LRINGQVQALDSYGQYSVGNGNAVKKADLSGSVSRAGSSAHDVQGLLLSVRKRASSGGLSELSRRAQESISQVQSAEVALQKADTALRGMRDLAVKSADIKTPDADRIVLDYEFTQFKFELDKIGTLSINGVDHSKSDVSAFISSQAVTSSGNMAPVSIEKISSDAIGNIRTAESARSAVSTIADAMDQVASARVNLGEAKTKLISENQGDGGSASMQQHSVSRIRDASAAVKMVEQIRNDMQFKPAHSILAHANAIPQAVLQLLG